MEISETKVRDAYRIVPGQIEDRRGLFYEAVRYTALSDVIGRPFKVEQVNFSVSRKGTLRGIHTTAVPPGQDKLVTCVRGAALDVVVDLRVGSPTFGTFDVTLQDEKSGTGVYMADGLGHAFLALTDDVCMNYLCSAEYVPGTMIDVDALDPALGIPWDLSGPLTRSDKDEAAPSVADAVATGLLPTYEECVAHYERQRVTV
jgi:NDP-hexose 5-epimerase